MTGESLKPNRGQGGVASAQSPVGEDSPEGAFRTAYRLVIVRNPSANRTMIVFSLPPASTSQAWPFRWGCGHRQCQTWVMASPLSKEDPDPPGVGVAAGKRAGDSRRIGRGF